MHPRKRLMLRRRDRARKLAAIATPAEPTLEEVVEKIKEEVVASPVVSKVVPTKRSTRKTRTTKKK